MFTIKTIRSVYTALVVFASLLPAARVADAQTVPPVVSPGATINFTLTKDTFVTLNITRPGGWIVRELVIGEKRKLGANQVFWDGRDNHGRLLPEGPYEWRLLTHDGITSTYITSLGNSGTPPWSTADGTGGWGGNLGSPVAVANDATGVSLGWNAAEGVYSITKRTLDGSKGIWGSSVDAYDGVMALASDSSFLYAARKNKLIKINLSTGREITSVDLDTSRPATDTAPLCLAGSVTFNLSREDVYGFVWGLAAGRGRVDVSNPWNNRIEVFETGSLSRVDTITVPRPRGLALGGQANLLVVTDGKVLSINLQTKVSTPVISTGLQAPFALARGAGGALFVTDLGTSQQVKKFSAAGLPLATFGRLGGGVDALTGGQFQPENFRQACAITVLADGTFWVAEDILPKRTARFSAVGKMLYQGFGSVNSSALVAPNPNDLNEVFSTMWGTFTGRVDYTTKTSTMGRILRPRWGPGGAALLGVEDSYTPEKMLSRNGKTYMWAGLGLGGGHTLYLVEPDHLRPVMVLIANLPEAGPLSDLANQRGIKRNGWCTEVTVWCDNNGDASVQAAEVRIVPIPNGVHGPQYFASRAMANDFSLFSSYGFSWKPRSFSAVGVPLFHKDDLLCVPGFDPSWNGYYEGEYPTRDALGNNYQVVNWNRAALPVGEGFWSGRSTESYLRSFSSTWGERWVIGRKAPKAALPGEMYYLSRNCGEMANCMFVSDMEGIVHIIHRSGFYVQSVLQDPFKSETPGPALLHVESLSGSVMEHPVTKRKFLYIASTQASHIFEIKGLPSILVKAPRAFTLARPASVLPAPTDYRIKRVRGARIVNDVVPNSGIDWPAEVSMMPIFRDGQLRGEVGLLYDDSYLYVRADMLAPYFSNWTSGAENIPYAYEGGHTLELLIGMNPAAPATRIAAVKGDQRIVYANTSALNQGALVMQPIAAGANPTPFSYKGATATTTLQNVQFWQADAGQIKVSVSDTVHGNGGVVQMAIPLSNLLLPGQTMEAIVGKPLRFDVGMVWPEAGQRVKSYWQGKNPKMLVANDRAIETKLYPDGWGNAIFDDSVPQDGGAVGAELATRQIDGSDQDWIAQPETTIQGTSGEVAQFRTAWDAQNFYASITVSDASPLLNGAGSPQLLLKGGDGIGFTFGTPGANQKILFAQVGGENVNMAYRPAWPVKKPYTFTSPVSTVTLDFVGAINAPSIPYRWSDNKYWLEVCIPWSELGITPQAGMQIPFDVQVIFGDAAGSTNERTSWWHSRSSETSATYDLPTEAKLYPTHWGKLLLK